MCPYLNVPLEGYVTHVWLYNVNHRFKLRLKKIVVLQKSSNFEIWYSGNNTKFTIGF